jgi:hypothetical protein
LLNIPGRVFLQKLKEYGIEQGLASAS